MNFPFKLSDESYNILKWIVILVFPAFATLYAHVGVTWGFPYVEEITATIRDVTTFLGIILCISNYTYNKEQEDGSGF